MVGHGGRTAAVGKAARHGDPIARLQLGDLLPPAQREQRMVAGRLDAPAQAGADAQHGLDAVAERGRDPGGPQAQIGTDGADPDLLAALVRRDDVAQLPAGARHRVVDEGVEPTALSHRRPCGDDDQVAGLEPAGDLVEVAEARRGPGQRRLARREVLPLARLAVQDVADVDEVLGALVVGDLEHRALGLLDDLAGQRLVVEHLRLDRVGGRQQPPHQRVLADDLGVAPGVAGRGHGGGQLVDGGVAARGLEAAVGAQVLGDRQDVDRLVLVVEVEDRLVDDGVALAVEVLGLQALVDDEGVEGAVGEQDRAEDRPLGLERMRGRGADRGGRWGRVGVRAHGLSTIAAALVRAHVQPRKGG